MGFHLTRTRDFKSLARFYDPDRTAQMLHRNAIFLIYRSNTFTHIVRQMASGGIRVGVCRFEVFRLGDIGNESRYFLRGVFKCDAGIRRFSHIIIIFFTENKLLLFFLHSS